MPGAVNPLRELIQSEAPYKSIIYSSLSPGQRRSIRSLCFRQHQSRRAAGKESHKALKREVNTCPYAGSPFNAIQLHVYTECFTGVVAVRTYIGQQ